LQRQLTAALVGVDAYLSGTDSDLAHVNTPAAPLSVPLAAIRKQYVLRIGAVIRPKDSKVPEILAVWLQPACMQRSG